MDSKRNSSNKKPFDSLVNTYQRRLTAYKRELERRTKGAKLLSADNIAAIKELSHRLAGSGKAYNFPALSRAAKALEEECESLEIQTKPTDTKAEQEPTIALLVTQLIKELTEAASATHEKALTQTSSQSVHKSKIPVTQGDMTLLMIDDDHEFSALLSKDLKEYGYQTHFLADISQLSDAIEYYQPDAILVDMDFYGERLAGAEGVTQWQERSGYPLPIIFISGHDSFDVRLAAVKAGGHHFLTKPVDMVRLEGLLQFELGVTEQDVPFRILLVDDDDDLLFLYQTVLEQDGYSVYTASNAKRALSILEQSNPELVIIDIFMPGCSGLELGRLIRQHEEFFDTSIVFMSASADTDIKLASARLSQDEFISKPIEPWRLRMVVKSRVEAIRKRQAARLTMENEKEIAVDPLTALPRGKALEKQLESLMKRNQQSLALLKVDIRDFHTINNLYGPIRGDELLQAIAWRLSEVVVNEEAVYRERGDEFYILLNGCQSKADVNKAIRRFQTPFDEPYTFGNEQSIRVSIDVGVVMVSPEITQPMAIIGHAETALFQAKSQANAAIVFFDESMKAWEEKRFNLGQALELAFLNDEFTAYYQPILSVQEQEVAGFELLARWQRPDFGLIPPNEFIQILEGNGLISKLTESMLKQGVIQLTQWQKIRPDLFMSVNLSVKDIESPQFLDELTRLIEHYSIDPQTIVLEITETTLLSNWQQASKVIALIKKMNVKLALDDFGTGFSSLNYLSRIDADKLKIDRSFIENWSKTGDARLVSAMVQLASSMGMKVVAEGVEQQKELLFLQELECDYYQGFLSAKPMLPADIESRFLS